MKSILLAAICLLCVDNCDSACPNLCNNNGLCGINNVCICHEGFTGPDCSRRICPYGKSWADKTTAIDTAHADSECSGAGICDSSSGQCHCFDGFTGHACQRSTCHNNCNNRGQCLSMADLALYYGHDYDPTALKAGDGLGPVYTNWENAAMLTCKCDYGFFGPDCSIIMCPKGDDPVTENQVSRQIQLQVVDESYPASFQGHLGVSFQGSTSYISLGAPSSEDCEQVLESNPKFGDITCNYTSNSSITHFFDITFNTWPTFPKENNLYSHRGNPANTDFLCDVSRTDSTVQCTFVDLVAANLKEYEYCSSRGICDYTTGNCLCASGYGGIACDAVHTAYFLSANAHVYQEVVVKSADYNSTAVSINTAKSSASDFKLLEASSNSKSFYVRGDGVVGADSLRIVESGLTVSKGGVMVAKGGVNITTDGAVVSNAEVSSPVLGAQSTDAAFDDTVLEARSMGTTPQHHYILRAVNQDLTRFSVRGDGLVGIADSGMFVTGGITVNSGGLTAKGGVTIYDDGLVVTGGVTVPSGDVTISDGIDVFDKGMIVNDGATIQTIGLVISQGGFGIESVGQTISSGGVMVSAGGVTIASGGLLATGGLSLNSGGMKTTDGGTVYSDGLKVSDGLSVFTDGTKVTAVGISVLLDGLKVRSSGLTVHSVGLKVTGGTTVYGLAVEADGSSVLANGMKVANGLYVNTGGIYVDSGGAFVTDGFSVLDVGIKTKAGVTVSTGGLYVGGGASVLDDGVTVIGGLTIPNSDLEVRLDGLKATGGVSIVGGAGIAAGVTVVDTGLMVTMDGLTISAGGMKATGGVSVITGAVRINSLGAIVTGGVSVGSGGMKVTGGVTLIDTGLYVKDTGMTVAGGMTVADGVTVLSDGLVVEAGGVQITGGTLSIQDLGLTVPSLTILDTGLAVDAGGVTVSTGGMKVAGGVSVSSGGLDVDVSGVNVAGGVTVFDAGMKIKSGLTLVDTGLVVLGDGATITSGGMDVSGAVTVADVGVDIVASGADVTGGFSVQDLGAKVNGGMTVANTGLVVTADGGTISGGLKVASGLTVTSSNLVVGQNMQASGSWYVATGAKVASGLTVESNYLSVKSGGITVIGDVIVNQNVVVDGTIFATTHTTPSDRRLKTNVEPLRNNLESITKLRGVYFNWRKDSVYANLTQREIGVIAQDVQAVFPEATSRILDDEYLGVDYIQLIPVLIEAIRELKDNYEDLSDTYDELNARTEGCDPAIVDNW